MSKYPRGLSDWAGHRSGGVRRLFDDVSGRPAGTVIHTPLIGLLESWGLSYVSDSPMAPRIILLVGGPGNGKTEAIEAAVSIIAAELGVHERIREFAADVIGNPDQPVPRRGWLTDPRTGNAAFLCVVQDASISDSTRPGVPPHVLLTEELGERLRSGTGGYIACINRGVLDDALSYASATRQGDLVTTLSNIVRAAAFSHDAPPCWPMDSEPEIAIWPMDLESLIVTPDGPPQEAPATRLHMIAVDQESWPPFGTCPAGDRCPHCYSRSALDASVSRQALMRILRFYELSEGKRWTFRDLATLYSYLLAGGASGDAGGADSCEAAARILKSMTELSQKADALQGPFRLLSAQYEHALFGYWPRFPAREITKALKELNLSDNRALLGFHYFLSSTKGRSVPTTLMEQLTGVGAALDPAMADAGTRIPLSARTTVTFRDIDTRFSHSVGDGLSFLRKYHCLSQLETDVLVLLAEADDTLSAGEVRRRKPATAARLQRQVREFACRTVRRGLGVRAGVVKDVQILEEFGLAVAGDSQSLHAAVKQVEQLINTEANFVVSLNSTFGESLPIRSHRALLYTPKQRAKPAKAVALRRPAATIPFIAVGTGKSSQKIPLTYELYRSVRRLDAGMVAASLPRTVLALLDTTRAKLAGGIVRDDDALDGSEIRLGLLSEVIVRELDSFVVRREE